MFFVSLHSVGGLANFETPVAYGPRHCGQKRSAVAAAPLWRDESAVAAAPLWRDKSAVAPPAFCPDAAGPVDARHANPSTAAIRMRALMA